MFVMIYRYQNDENLDILTEIVILTSFGQISKFRSCVHFQSAPHGHEIPARGISLQKPSVHDWGRPQCAGELWRRLRITPTIVSNIEDFTIFLHTRYRLGEVYGGARVWQESCAWGRDKLESSLPESHREKMTL